MYDPIDTERTEIMSAVRGEHIQDAEERLDKMGWKIVKEESIFSPWISTVIAQSSRRQLLMCTKYGRVCSVFFGRILPAGTGAAELENRFAMRVG
jgi:hypothetical protein